MGCGSANVQRDVKVERKITRTQSTTRTAYVLFKQSQVTKFLTQLFPTEIPPELSSLPSKLLFDSHGISQAMAFSEIDFLNTSACSITSLVHSPTILIIAALDLLKTKVISLVDIEICVFPFEK